MIALTLVTVVFAMAVPVADGIITIASGHINGIPRHTARLLAWRGVGYMLLSPMIYAIVILFNGYFPNLETTELCAMIAAVVWLWCGSAISMAGMVLKSRS